MTRRGKAITAVAVVAILAGGLTLAAFKRGEKPVDVRLEKVQKRDLVAYVTASGQVQPHTKVDVASDVSGRIVKLSVKEGDIVKKGQFLLQIDPATYQADVQREAAGVASARADLARAKANLEQSQNSYRRSSEIVKENPALISGRAARAAQDDGRREQRALPGGAAHGRSDERGAAELAVEPREDDDSRADGWTRSRGSPCSRARRPCPAPSARTRRCC